MPGEEYYVVSKSSLKGIADKIRTKGGTSADLEYPDGFEDAVDAIPSGGGTYQAKSGVTPTTSSQTIQPDSGYDALSSVQINAMPNGTAGTPTATKGAVSNHSVAVTPSVTNAEGYVPSETKTGTPVTVSASELVSGSETKTANGTYDVTNLAQLIVNVSGGGGGASNLVSGTFKGTTTGAAMDVTLNYTGSGYPIAVMVYPKEGTYKSGGAYYNLIQKNAANFYMAIKNDPSTAPTYSGTNVNENYSSTYQYRKNSATTSTSYTGTSSVSGKNYMEESAISNNGGGIVMFKSNTKMSVYIAIAGSSYGFAANIEYSYYIIYSS